MNSPTIKTLLLTWYILCASAFAFANQYVTNQGDYTINHSIFPSLDLQPEMAHKFGITRGENIAIVVISVSQSKKLHAGSLVATVSGTAKDLLSRKRELPFAHIQSGEHSHYYIATIKYTNNETLVFDFVIALEQYDQLLTARVTKLFT